MTYPQKNQFWNGDSSSMDETCYQILTANKFTYPFLHWTIINIIPTDLLLSLSLITCSTNQPYSCNGLREGTNRRIPITVDAIATNETFANVANIFCDRLVVQSLRHTTGKSINESKLRISLCIDQQGFWLKPHTDISKKLLTIIIYINQTQKSEKLGTDLYDAMGNLIYRTSSEANNALLFIPSQDTYHGFEKSFITGERRTLIINYVNDEWKDVHDLTGLRVND
jgi:hypothetical protein